jgi:hypothetical protein
MMVAALGDILMQPQRGRQPLGDCDVLPKAIPRNESPCLPGFPANSGVQPYHDPLSAMVSMLFFHYKGCEK